MKRMIRQEVYGMARVGFIKHLEVYVNTDDGGEIPHFHLHDSKNWEKFHTCIKIESPEYFLHAGKEDVLNSKERKLLQEFMESPVSVSRYASKFGNNWELICFLWDTNNSTHMIAEDAEVPDYTQLSE